MIDEFQWFERTFVFDLPVWMYPNVVERLRGTPARAEDMTASLDQAALTWRDGDAWSIQENVGHLCDLEPLWLGRLDDVLNGKAVLREADLENRKTHEADHNASPINDLLRVFRKQRQRLVERLDELDETDVVQTARHPRLDQPMRVLDLIFFVAEHDDHHLAQVTRLKHAYREM